MRITVDSPEAQADSGRDVTFGFFVENPGPEPLPCTYRVEQLSAGAPALQWRVDGPTRLASGESGRGALSVRAPKNRGPEDQMVALHLVASTGQSAADAREACTLVVQPAAWSLRPKVTPNPDGTVGAKLSLHRRGRAAVDAQVNFRQKDGWRFYPERPSITIHTDSGPRKVVAPKSRWYLPDVTITPDGTVTVKVSLFNRKGVDVKASIRLRHDDGWWFSAEQPELTVRAGKGPVDVSAKFRLPDGHQAQPGDAVTVQLQYQGVPVADAGTTIARPKVAYKRAAKAAAMIPLALWIGAGFLNETDPPTPRPVVATTIVEATTTLPPAPPEVPPDPPPSVPAPPSPPVEPGRPGRPGQPPPPPPTTRPIPPPTTPATSPPQTAPPTTTATTKPIDTSPEPSIDTSPEPSIDTSPEPSIDTSINSPSSCSESPC